MKKKICILGAGGFGREVLCCLADTIKGSNLKLEDIACFMVDDQYYKQSTIMGVSVIKRSDFVPENYDVVIAIGEPLIRKKIASELPPETTYATIVHPNAIVSDWVEIGKGSIVTAGNVITCNIKIGDHAHLNLNTTIGHDCLIGDFFTTAPGAHVSGNCTFADCVYLGTNSAVKNGITICNDVTIGMGAMVVKSINESGVYIGNPSKKLEKKS